MAPALHGRGLRKAFGDVVALDGVDLAVAPGTIHGLVGPNGAGKTTLLAAIFGLLPLDDGTLSLFGRTPRGRPGDLDGVAGFVEAPRFYPYLDAAANLRGLALLDGGTGPGRVEAVLEEVGLAGCGRRRVGGFSLGMRQRLGLAAALLRSPRLLVLDEPANGLDPLGLLDLRALLRRLAANGVAVLLSSHDMPTVEELCDRVTVLSGGRVAFDGTLEALSSSAPHPAVRVRTSDDATAWRLAVASSMSAGCHDDGGLTIRADQTTLDAWVVQLGRQGVAVRSLTLAQSPLEALFVSLTAGAEGAVDPAVGPR